jgi:hypothetical protein
VTIEFMLATQAESIGGLTLLSELMPPVITCVPIAIFQIAQDEPIMGDGSVLPTGSPSADWIFPLLTLEEYVTLKSFAGWCYLRTIDDEGTYADYLAFLAWPISPPKIQAGLIFNLTLHFTMMVVQEELS